MPSGATVYYRDKDHAYWTGHDEKTGKCSGRVPGISTVSKNCGDTSTDGLLDWAARLTCEGVAQAAATQLNEEWLVRGDTIQAVLRDSGSTWRQMRDAAGVRGSFSHDVLQNLSEGVTPILQSGYDHAVIDWWKKRRPDVSLVEQVVYSDQLNIAGRFDLMAHIDGRRTLLDLKTSRYASNAFAIQLNLYALAAEDAGFPRPDCLVILQVREDGGWQELDVPINSGWAQSSLEMYVTGKEIRSALGKARKSQVQGDSRVAA
jgi:hypothetical protein